MLKEKNKDDAREEEIIINSGISEKERRKIEITWEPRRMTERRRTKLEQKKKKK